MSHRFLIPLTAWLMAGVSIATYPFPARAQTMEPTDSTPADPALMAAKSESAVRAYLDGDYPAAQTMLEELAATLGDNAERLYDLGLVRYRRGQTAQACADFRRARWLTPGDTDLEGNLKLCNNELPAFALPHVYRAADMAGESQRWLALQTRLWVVPGVWVFFWVLWLAKRRWRHRVPFGLALFATAILFLWSGSSLLADLWLRPAYVTTGTQLMSGQLQDAMELRPIAAGNRALILRTEGAWTMIEIEGTMGWVLTTVLAPYGARTLL